MIASTLPATQAGRQFISAKRLCPRYFSTNVRSFGQRLYFGFMYFHRYRPLNQLDRKHDAKLLFTANKNSFHSRHRTAVHADATTDLEVGMWLQPCPARETLAQSFQFGIGEGNRHSAKTDKLHHSR